MYRSPTGIYRYRRAVPAPLRDAVGVREIKKSLGKDFDSAMGRYRVVHREADAAVAKAGQAAEPTTREEVLRVLRRAGIGPRQIDLLMSGDVPDRSSEALEVIWSELVDDYEEAEQAGREPRASVEAIRAIGAGRIPEQTHTIASALDTYLVEKKSGDEAKDRSLENRISKLKQRLIAVLGRYAVTKRPLGELKRAEVLRVRDAMLLEMGPSSVKRVLNILRAAINGTIREHDLDIRNPMVSLEIKGAGTSRDDRLPFTEAEMELLDPVMFKGPEDPLSVLWVALRDTGGRPSEVCTRRVDDVDFDAATLSIPYGKTRNAVRTIPLSPDALGGLQKLARGRNPGDPLFPAYATGRGPDSASQALMKRIRKKISDPKKVAYSLRHRMKDRLRDVGCPRDIQEQIMGHDLQRVADNYGTGYALQRMREYLEQVWAATPTAKA